MGKIWILVAGSQPSLHALAAALGLILFSESGAESLQMSSTGPKSYIGSVADGEPGWVGLAHE